jgi:hypothetical protein
VKELKPLDPPMVPFVLGGMAIWAAAGLVLFIANVKPVWQEICLAGILVALPGLALMIVHDRHRARRRAASDS